MNNGSGIAELQEVFKDRDLVFRHFSRSYVRSLAVAGWAKRLLKVTGL